MAVEERKPSAYHARGERELSTMTSPRLRLAATPDRGHSNLDCGSDPWQLTLQTGM